MIPILSFFLHISFFHIIFFLSFVNTERAVETSPSSCFSVGICKNKLLHQSEEFQAQQLSE